MDDPELEKLQQLKKKKFKGIKYTGSKIPGIFGTQRESLYDRVNTIDDESTNEEQINE